MVRAKEIDSPNILTTGANPDEIGLVNQWGLSRKVCVYPANIRLSFTALTALVATLCSYQRKPEAAAVGLCRRVPM